jgi:hypothetical protein
MDKEDDGHESTCPRIDRATGKRCGGTGSIGRDVQNRIWIDKEIFPPAVVIVDLLFRRWRQTAASGVLSINNAPTYHQGTAAHAFDLQ